MIIAVEMTDYSPVESSPIAMVRHLANPGSMNSPNPPYALSVLFPNCMYVYICVYVYAG